MPARKSRLVTLRLLLRRLMGAVPYEHLTMWIKHHYWPHIRNPRSLNEHISHRKLFKPFPQSHILADKHAVRSYVTARVGDHVLSKLYFAGANPEDIPFSTLPEKYVVKVNNGSGGNLFVRSRDQTKPEEIKAWCRRSLSKVYGIMTNEFWYADIEPQIIIEEFLEDPEREVPLDFKFFCFGGKPVLVQVDYERFMDHRRRFFDMDWNPQEFMVGYHELGPIIEKPKNFDEMKSIAAKLSAGADFLRVDLYSLGVGVRFGEITLSPGSGWEPFQPREIDFKLGQLWNA